jgi:aminopeptidase-like protein
VCIDADLRPGSLSYGELFLPGETDEQVLVSTHTCHPSLANDNLSGIVVAAFLAAQLQQTPQRLSYRFLFLPGTIGPITWLALNREVIPRIHHGLVLACLGDAGPMTYKRSRQGKAAIDQAVELVLRDRGAQHEIRDFSPTGFDERQYCSPGFNLPVGRLTRTAEGEFAEYHSSSDNLELVRPEYLANSLDCCMEIFAALDANIVYQNRHPWCEPRLGSAGLYDTYGADNPMRAALQEAVQWVLSFSDQQHSLLDIAQRSGLPLAELREAAERLVACELIHRANKSQG